MTILAQGRHIGFRTDKPGLLEEIQERLPPGWKPSDRVRVRRVYSVRVAGAKPGPGPRRTHSLYMNAQRIHRSRDLEDLLDRLESDLHLYVAERATRRIFVHAGVVGWKGRGILLPGRTFTGKSTLVAELLRLGATYYSDEYAVLDAKGRVHPFPRPLSIRSDQAHERPVRLGPEEFGTEAGREPLPVGLVAFTHFKAGVRWRPRHVTAGKGVMALLENTVPARRRPKASLAALRQVVSAAPVIRGARGEAREMAETLLARVE
jgi:hypothetical protein